MRNFILFIRRYFNVILFLLLEIVCGWLIARSHSLQGDSLVHSGNRVSGFFYEKRSQVIYYFNLKRMNDSLLAENQRLNASLLNDQQGTDTLNIGRHAFPIYLNDSQKVIRYADYTLREARVINNSIQAENNFITINIGEKQGLKKNMAVISGNGVVGRVVHVSRNYASVLSILNIKQHISAKLKDGNLGSVVWEEGNPDKLFLKDIPEQIPVKVGDSVYTTSFSFFPQDVLIGTVTKKFIIKKNNLQLLQLKPATNFRTLQYVYVVDNAMMDERKQMEDSAKRSVR